MLGIFKNTELRVILDGAPDEEAEGVFVDDESEDLKDGEGVKSLPVTYVEPENEEGYASFKPEVGGLYTVAETPDTVEDEADEEAEDVTDEETEDATEDEIENEPEGDAEEAETPAAEAPTATPEPTAAPTATPMPAPTAEPAPTVVPDPEAKYGYSRRSNEGNQYWLIDTREKTVEYFSEVNDEYWIGDYDGSLMSGMNVTLRNRNKIINIALKFQQTYKFALMNGDGAELLMEQEDIARVEAAIKSHR